MHEPVSLRSASVQDIQLELLRRTRFNEMDGEEIHASLLKHRDPWLAALFDSPGVPNYDKPGILLLAGLLKLRDLPDDIWNADTLFLLTPTRQAADRLAAIAEEEAWCGLVRVYKDREEMEMAVGIGRQEFGLLSVWWD